MEWFTANWFWVVISVAFVAMHLFGHGGHGGHGGHSGHGGGDRQGTKDARDREEARRAASESAAWHED